MKMMRSLIKVKKMMLLFNPSGPMECNLDVCFCLIVFVINILLYFVFVEIIMCIVILNHEKRINCRNNLEM
jgi:hypothetical protein